MSLHTYKCPSCGAPLKWEPSAGRIACDYCNGSFSVEEVENFNQELQAKEEAAVAAETGPDKASLGESDQKALGQDQLKTYVCNSCGAELVTDASTSATFCYYCHSPLLLVDRLSGKFKPDRVIPFQISKEKAQETFRAWASQKKYAPRGFSSESQLEKMTGVYLPVWLARVKNSLDFQGQGRVTKRLDSQRESIETYDISRQGDLALDNLLQTAFSSGDKIKPEAFESIANFRWEDSVPFSPAYLSGYYAELWSVSPEEAGQDATQRSKDLAHNELMAALHAQYDSFNLARDAVAAKLDHLDYVLAPAWALTFKFGQDTYLYVMNGQTGQIYGEVPLDKVRVWRSGGLIAAIILILLLLGGYFIW